MSYKIMRRYNIGMNATGIILIILSLVLVGALFPLLIRKRTRHLSGKAGEETVSNLISRLKEDGEILINDYVASRNKTKTSSIQIDHIFISHKGVFVIETKDYRGRIYGGKYQNYWTQTIGRKRIQKNKLYNPIKQNETHVNYVKKIIEDNVKVFNIVIFLEADISRVNDVQGNLFNSYSFRTFYRMLPNNRLNDLKIKNIESRLLNEINSNPISKEEHVMNVRRRHGDS